MSKYINADDYKYKVIDMGASLIEIDLRYRMLNALDEMPSADAVEVKRGVWVGNSFDFYCSNCKQYQNFYAGKSNFCPNCGADMRSEK